MKTKKMTIKVRVLLIREGEMWSAQCLEHDIAAQGKTQHEAQEAFGKTFLGQISLDIMENIKPLQNTGKAPQEFFDLFEQAIPPKDPRRFCVPSWALPGFIINAQANDMRIYQPA